MKLQQHKKSFVAVIVTLSILLVVIGVAGTLALLAQPKADDPYATKTPATESTENTAPANDTPEKATEPEKPAPQTTLAPEEVATIDIPSLAITVSYKKGVGGFEYRVGRAAAGTQYVEFSNATLIGTKCTNDRGVFASIIKNPTASDQATISQTTKVADDVYGLSLAGASCTSDAASFSSYQSAFKDGFSLLKALSTGADTTQ